MTYHAEKIYEQSSIVLQNFVGGDTVRDELSVEVRSFTAHDVSPIGSEDEGYTLSLESVLFLRTRLAFTQKKHKRVEGKKKRRGEGRREETRRRKKSCWFGLVLPLHTLKFPKM